MFLFLVMKITIIFSFLIFLICLAIRFYAKLIRGRCKCNIYLAGKTALVTGGNSGLGYQTALALAGRGCRVIIADKDNCDQTREEIIRITGNNNIVTKQFDLASLSSVRKLAKNINDTEERLDILINNAGVGGVGNVYTEDGLHMGMQVNHFGPFLLTHLLVGLLKKSAPSRIIFVSSSLVFLNNLSTENLNPPAHIPATVRSDIAVYSNSKLCNLITTKELAKKLLGTGVTVNALHPGLVYTPIFEKSRGINTSLKKLCSDLFLSWFARTAEEGAQTTIHLALAKEGEKITGEFFSECQLFRQPAKAKDANLARKIWEASEKYVKLLPEEKL